MRFLFLLITYILLAQNALAQRAVVGLPKMNMLYIGLENPINVAVDGIKAKDLVVEINGGELKGGKGKYIFKPDGTYKTAVLKIGINKPNKIVWVDSVEYKVSRLPNPIIAFGTITEENISTKDAVNAMVINAFVDETFPFKYYAIVTVYTFAMKSDSTGETYFENVNGNKITETIRQKLKNSRTGDLIILAEVEYKILGLNYRHNRGINRQFYIYNRPEVAKSKLVQPEETLRYHNKKVKLQFKNNLTDSSGTYSYFYENGDIFIKGNYLIRDNFTLAIDDSAFIGENYHSIYREIDKCLFGYQEAFYKNGKLREAGNFDTSYNYLEQVACFQSRPDLGNIYKKPLYLYSVRHGLWKFYDEKGKLIRQTIYDKGHIKED